MADRTPRRIQLRRTAGWRKPSGAVVVSRPSRWGNPILLGDVTRSYPSLTMEQVHGMAVAQFEDIFRSAELRGMYGYPSDEEIRAVLVGKDLCCWCPLSVPCHVSPLLRVANSPGGSGE